MFGAARRQQFPNRAMASTTERGPSSPHFSTLETLATAGNFLVLGRSGELLAGQPGRLSAQDLQRLGAAQQHQRHEGEAVQDAGPRQRGLSAGGAKIQSPSQER